jgi:hypothetical protein
MNLAAFESCAMPSKENYLAKAEQCSQMAAEPNTDLVAATFLRMLAADYLDVAAAGKKQPSNNNSSRYSPKSRNGKTSKGASVGGLASRLQQAAQRQIRRTA